MVRNRNCNNHLALVLVRSYRDNWLSKESGAQSGEMAMRVNVAPPDRMYQGGTEEAVVGPWRDAA